MNFLDGSLFPEHQERLVITVAPYGPEWMPADFTDIPVSMDEQVQKAVDCYNAGASVLHIHVREADGKGSKRLSKFNELLSGLRAAVPDMLLQVGGSISFAPENDGAAAKWLSDDTRHMLAELTPKPDQVTIAINTVADEHRRADGARRHRRNLARRAGQLQRAYREMIVPVGPELGRGARPPPVGRRHPECLPVLQHQQLRDHRAPDPPRRVYKGPLVRNWVAIGGGMDATPNIYNLANFLRACPDGAVLTLESTMLNDNVLPINTMGIAMGLHVRCGIEDNLWTQDHKSRMTTVRQVEQLVRISREFGREIATGKDAKRISRIGEFYASVDETLEANGFAPNRAPAPRQALPRAA